MTVPSAATVAVQGSFNGNVDWAVIALEITPQAGLAKQRPTSQDEKQAEVVLIPSDYELDQNHPNPFNPSTTITFAVPKAGEITLSIYNLRGQLVHSLHAGPIAAGRHKIVWDGADVRGAKVASGIYVYQLKAEGMVMSKKLVLTK